jgi:hypothetical protein
VRSRESTRYKPVSSSDFKGILDPQTGFKPFSFVHQFHAKGSFANSGLAQHGATLKWLP